MSSCTSVADLVLSRSLYCVSMPALISVLALSNSPFVKPNCFTRAFSCNNILLLAASVLPSLATANKVKASLSPMYLSYPVLANKKGADGFWAISCSRALIIALNNCLIIDALYCISVLSSGIEGCMYSN